MCVCGGGEGGGQGDGGGVARGIETDILNGNRFIFN